MRRKKRLAFIGVGMVGTGSLGHGIPALANALGVLVNEYDITVYSFIPVTKNKVPPDIRVRCVPSYRMPQRLQYFFLGVLFIWDNLRGRYNVIHAQSPFPAGILAFYLAKLLNTPWLLTLHAGEVARLSEVPFGDLLNPYMEKVALKCCKAATLLSALSQWQANDVAVNLKLDREIIILTRGAMVYPRKSKHIATPLKLLHVSNYHPIKDYEMLMKTFQLLSTEIPCELTVVGSTYPPLLSVNTKDIRFTGALNQQELNELYNQSHVLLHTSIFEGLPMVALEAMAHGVVVCGTHVGIMADLSEKYCITVPPKEAEKLAHEIILLFHDQNKYQRIRQEAYEWIQNHDLFWHVNQLKKVYQRLESNN